MFFKNGCRICARGLGFPFGMAKGRVGFPTEMTKAKVVPIWNGKIRVGFPTEMTKKQK